MAEQMDRQAVLQRLQRIAEQCVMCAEAGHAFDTSPRGELTEDYKTDAAALQQAITDLQAAPDLDALRIRIKIALRDELMHPYGEQGDTGAYRAIERAMTVVDAVFRSLFGSKGEAEQNV